LQAGEDLGFGEDSDLLAVLGDVVGLHPVYGERTYSKRGKVARICGNSLRLESGE
jgi:hypothetical protein